MIIRHSVSCLILLAASASVYAADLRTTTASPAFADLTAPLEIVLERDPSRVPAAKRLARLYAESRNWNAAWRVLERSAPYTGKDAEYQGFSALVLSQLKRPQEAAAYYRRAITLQSNEGRWWVGLGLALGDSGDRKGARAAFAAAQERDNTLPPVLLKVAERQGR
ncbi:MAG: tetratricopeptide repeat protein [Zoogloeaceae bacterium]|nr:tetratricopeptide repeat protein [Zoogloeaceae bacterium]